MRWPHNACWLVVPLFPSFFSPQPRAWNPPCTDLPMSGSVVPYYYCVVFGRDVCVWQAILPFTERKPHPKTLAFGWFESVLGPRVGRILEPSNGVVPSRAVGVTGLWSRRLSRRQKLPLDMMCWWDWQLGWPSSTLDLFSDTSERLLRLRRRLPRPVFPNRQSFIHQ